ncbi:Fe(3+) ABC transporter substrate-binding protein [Desulfonatronum thioautotrophicum]|uniref:Fe(3+) ABC transporter substrate-binding protein n=1 Tax=Desulfonatronum thioautotrophicum TaxID=617001 RepID=UPI0005EB4169|nr:Fe(3+) ABC transporter substrate-binding protein [Desulfonatronum thioautotrophicum]
MTSRLLVVKLRLTALFLAGCFLLSGVMTANAAEVNIYSSRQEHLIKHLLDDFTAETGIRYNLLTGDGPGLLERLRREGRNSPADVLITVDVANLVAAKNAEVLQPIQSSVLEENILPQYRDDEGFWYGLSARARIIYYDPERVDRDKITTYESLADPELGQLVCVRSSSNVYNISLTASLIAHHGEEQTEQWVRGLVGNFARTPQDNDTAQIRAVAAGECGVSIANSYYFGRLLASDAPADQDVTSRVQVMWPNQEDRGAHMNVSGAGVTASSRNVDAATKLIEFLSKEHAQEIYARVNHEFPVNPNVQPSGPVVEMGSFKADELELSVIQNYTMDAVRVMDRGGWR